MVGIHINKKIENGYDGGGGDGVSVAADHAVGVGVAEGIRVEGGARVCPGKGIRDTDVAADECPGGESESRL